jgi:ABC-2 type transport system ATP-binding protein
VEEAERADRVVILHRGRVVENAPPAAIMQKAGRPTLSEAFLGLIETKGKAAAAPAAEGSAP